MLFILLNACKFHFQRIPPPIFLIPFTLYCSNSSIKLFSPPPPPPPPPEGLNKLSIRIVFDILGRNFLLFNRDKYPIRLIFSAKNKIDPLS
ncbi:hypothetical protein CW304_21355 [Bacillus sp. UFRGS-B20]|nr:hypothetical protein CW304_21355 [Bacillus sp. UFRGS-B20]